MLGYMVMNGFHPFRWKWGSDTGSRNEDEGRDFPQDFRHVFASLCELEKGRSILGLLSHDVNVDGGRLAQEAMDG